MAYPEPNQTPPRPDARQDRQHPYTEPRFVAAIAILALCAAIGIGLMLARVFVPLGLAICLVAIPMVVGIYREHLRRRARTFLAEMPISEPTVRELGTIMIITCIFSAIAFAVFVIVQTQFPWPEAAPPPISVSPAEANSLRLLSPGEFASVVTKLTKDLRALDTSYGNEEARIMMQTTAFNDTTDKTKMQTQWSDRMKQGNEIRERLNFEWQTKYRSRSRAAYEDLCRRLGIIPDNRMNNAMPQNQLEARMLLTTGMLAGVYPISALADYLDSLASQVN